MLSISKMPLDARVWVFQSSKIFTESELAGIEKAGNEFIANWTAHGASLKTSFDILYQQFIVISVDEQQASASGCSIDKGIHFVKELEKQFNINLLDRMQVAYRSGSEIKTCHINNLLEELTRQGLYSNKENGVGVDEIIVFNNMVSTKKQFDNEWEIPLKKSWQSRILPA